MSQPVIEQDSALDSTQGNELCVPNIHTRNTFQNKSLISSFGIRLFAFAFCLLIL